jgi:ribonuclease E
VGPFSLAPADIPLEQQPVAAFEPVAETPPVVVPVAAPVEAIKAPQVPIAAPVEAPAASAPQAEAFVLPLGDLNAIAQGAGLQWVNSDSDKVQAIRNAIANEPKPVHVPRERPPAETVDEGPLVLVETRKDLSQIKLPFESAAR